MAVAASGLRKWLGVGGRSLAAAGLRAASQTGGRVPDMQMGGLERGALAGAHTSLRQFVTAVLAGNRQHSLARPARRGLGELIGREAASGGCLRLPSLAAYHTAIAGAKQGMPAGPVRWRAALATMGPQIRRLAAQAVATFPSAAPAAAAARAGVVPVDATAGALVAGGVQARRAVGWWLFGCAGWVASMVVLGGVTRLTRSGLSMTEWRFAGTLPPLCEEDWEREFAKYKASPEYRRVNLGMQMPDFKFIFWMEYAHRMWGRALGLVFLGPFAYFAARGYVTRRLGGQLAVLGSLGAGQGFVGWWMVKSGLEEPPSEHGVPRVSPYRLAAHLASAFLIYSGLLWTALNVAMPAVPLETAAQLAAAARARRMVHPVAALVGVTALSGAFVAGNDAGHAYNTFPKMGDHWVPPSVLEMRPLLRNFFENTATVQLDHRVLATTTLASVGGLWWATSRLPLHASSALLVKAMLGMTALQVTLGVSTLLTYVPVSLGSAHQAGALTLFTIVLTLLHTLRRPSPAVAAALAKGTLRPIA